VTVSTIERDRPSADTERTEARNTVAIPGDDAPEAQKRKEKEGKKDRMGALTRIAQAYGLGRTRDTAGVPDYLAVRFDVADNAGAVLLAVASGAACRDGERDGLGGVTTLGRIWQDEEAALSDGLPPSLGAPAPSTVPPGLRPVAAFVPSLLYYIAGPPREGVVATARETVWDEDEGVEWTEASFYASPGLYEWERRRDRLGEAFGRVAGSLVPIGTADAGFDDGLALCVIGALVEDYGLNGAGDVGVLYGWIDESTLADALYDFAGRRAADAVLPLVEPAVGLPPIDDDIKAWSRVCSADGGEEDGAGALLDVARRWGVRPTPDQRERLRSLCGALAPEAVHRAAPGAPRVAPAAAREGPPLLTVNEIDAVGDSCRAGDTPFVQTTPQQVEAVVRRVFGDVFGHGPRTAGETELMERVETIVQEANRCYNVPPQYLYGGRIDPDPGIERQAYAALAGLRSGIVLDARHLADAGAVCRALTALVALSP
jgi:hypothetical protein